MQVFIAGATGQVGRKAVEKAIDAGHAVTGMIRREEDREDLEAIGAKTYMADVTEPGTLDRAVAGHDAVVFAVGSQGEAVEKVDRDGAINLCDATKRAGIGRFVVLSSMGAGPGGCGSARGLSAGEARGGRVCDEERAGLDDPAAGVVEG